MEVNKMTNEQTQAKAPTESLEQIAADVKTIVNIRPGTSGEKGLRFRLPEDKYEATFGDLIKYALTRDDLRKEERFVERLKKEMEKKYGITANGKVVVYGDGLKNYVVEKTLSDGTKYNELEIVVASEEEGGFYRK
jgi:hypothetical protein